MDDEAKLTLHGLQQHYVKLKENEKNKKLFELLDILEFNQVLFALHRMIRNVNHHEGGQLCSLLGFVCCHILGRHIC